MNNKNPSMPNQTVGPISEQPEPSQVQEEDSEDHFHFQEFWPQHPIASFQRQQIADTETEESIRKNQEMLKEIIHNLYGIDRKVEYLKKTVQSLASPKQGISQLQALQKIDALVKEMLNEQHVIKDQLAQQIQSNEVLTAQSKTLENASKEMAQLTDRSFDERVIQPMAKALFPMFDLMEEFHKHWSKQPNKENRTISDLLSALQTELIEFLATYNIEPFQHRPETPFDSKLMIAIKTSPAQTKEERGRIKESYKAGFRWNSRILRAEQVVVYS